MPNVDAETREMLLAFVDEGREVISETEPLLVELEQQADADTVQAIFRMFHSMKGSAGFLGLANIQGITHDAETLLQRIRDGEIEMDAHRVDVLCHALDLIADRLEKVETSFHDEDDAEAAQAMRKLLQAANTQEAPPAPKPKHGGPPACAAACTPPCPGEPCELTGLLDDVESLLFALDDGPGRRQSLFQAGTLLDRVAAQATDRIAPTEQACRQASATLRRCEAASPEADGVIVLIVDLVEVMRELLQAYPDHKQMASATEDLLTAIDEHAKRLPLPKLRLGDILVADGHAIIEELDRAFAMQHEAKPIGRILVEQVGLSQSVVDAALAKQRPASDNSKGDDGDDKSSPTARRHETLRVDVAKLDALMDLVGELIIGTTAVIHNPAINELGVEGFDKSAAQLDRITRALQDVAMSLRMTPVEKTFKRMTRLVRDVAHKRARQVQLIVDGEDTEVDKSIAEIISDPLVHVLRNAVDHGIESPADRVAAGKPAEGTVRLSARHQGGEVWVTIEDDGRGLDKDAIYAKAVERGLTEKPLHALSDREVFGFVFAPGFSTAEVLSDISGRGVGMDVARRNLESVNGRVDVHSVAGKGTTVTLRIPLTLAIIEGMLVRVAEAWFTIPMLQVQESVRVPESAITVLHTGQEMVRIRNRLLPVLRLHDLYRIEEAMTHIPDGLLVVVEDDTEAFCLFVDELIGQRQTVIKSLSGFVGNLNGLSGCTVLGDGRISLILDVAELHRRNLGSRGRTA